MNGLWTPPLRSAQTQALFDMAEADRLTRGDSYDLDPERIETHMLKRFDDEPADRSYRVGLGEYVRSAEADGRLNAVGTKVVIGSASGRLRARLRMDAHLAAHPEIRERRIDRPIFIIGGWRTGTTLLQRLMAAVPSLRGAYPAELSEPWKAPHPNDASTWEAFLDRRDAQTALDALNPDLKTVHPFGNREAEECVLAMGTDFRNWGFPSTIRLDSYVEWLDGQDFTESYERYANVLRTLQGEVPTRWVLKAPAHTAELAALLRVFPDACVIHLHRDVVATITSGCSLFAVFRSTYSDEVDPVQLGRYQLDTTAQWFERSMVARDELAHDHPSHIVELDFRDLVADPIGTTKRLCVAFEVDTDAATIDATLAERLDHLNRQHGSHRYAPEQFGLEPEQIRERLSAYSTRFGLDDNPR